jgi:hypothetical protein
MQPGQHLAFFCFLSIVLRELLIFSIFQRNYPCSDGGGGSVQPFRIESEGLPDLRFAFSTAG